MKYVVDKRNRPAYLQLYRQLRKDITDGIYKYGAKLPSKRLLAKESGVSVITVEHSYSLLCDEGYTEARERKGYFVIYKEKDFLTINEKNEADKEMLAFIKELFVVNIFVDSCSVDSGNFPLYSSAKALPVITNAIKAPITKLLFKIFFPKMLTSLKPKALKKL